ncbi:MAG: bifunctional oligoribonuclease/PAP phosphatase NrnA [Ruminococcus sp.]|jgi:phosphoesterase RecJ-like protein|nr:bifunctional oligoribonuclease/PAP phosphatase NrnA [Ruminococcus sp.]
MNLINAESAARLLLDNDRFLIITHRNPDGDTLGAGFGLCFALCDLGKKARVVNSDPLPKKFASLYESYKDEEYKPEFIIAVDTADTKLFGAALTSFAGKVNLCIDHHHGNSGYAESLCLDADAASACEVVFDVLEAAGAAITPKIAECLYTGIVTDTGCFRYSGTTPKTLCIASKLMETGIGYSAINRRIFETKTRTRVALEMYAIRNTEYYLDSRCAFAAIPKTAADEMKVTDEDYDGLAALTTQVEGVDVGILVKEKEKGKFRISIRSAGHINVSEITENFGGGGHIQAAGCSIDGKLEDVRMKLLAAVAKSMGIALFLV